MKRKLLVFVVLPVAVTATAVAVIQQRNGGPQAIEVEAAAVDPMTIVETATATGRIQPEVQVNISADVSAKITRIAVKEGDWVEKGALLVELDRERLLATVEVAEASLRAAASNADLARENMVKAEKDHERIRELHARRLESEAALDASFAAAQAEKARYQSSLDQAEQARATLRQTREDLSKTTIYAPQAGTISKLNKEVGEIALGAQFQEDVILVISNLNGMEALVDVDENDIVRISLGDPATIEVDALPGVVLHGEVSEIANTAKLSGSGTADQKTEFEVKVAVTDARRELRPGMTASAEIVTETKNGVLGVPIQSVAVRTPAQLAEAAPGADAAPGAQADAGVEFKPDRDGFVELVWLVDGEHVQARQVTTGIQSDSHIEIVSGLAEGDSVVIGNYRAISKDLRNGSLVAVKTPPPAPKGELVAQR